MSCGRKIKYKLNAYIYSKCEINKCVVNFANNLNAIKCMHSVRNCDCKKNMKKF